MLERFQVVLQGFQITVYEYKSKDYDVYFSGDAEN